MIHGGLLTHECAKALGPVVSSACLQLSLAKDFHENEEYKKLIKALCAEGEVHAVMID
jgi:small subunit ribosomal protein S12e